MKAMICICMQHDGGKEVSEDKFNVNKALKTFSWTEEETSLLLQVVIDCKASKTAVGLDWETIKTDLKKLPREFRARSPENLQMLTFMFLWRPSLQPRLQ